MVTVSEFEKERISNFMGLKNNLTAIYNGVGSHFTKIDDADVLTNAKLKYHLPDHFLFFLGNTDPKKHSQCAESFCRFQCGF